MFALGCFWGAERCFWETPGVYTTAVGYAGGVTPNPTYEEVSAGGTGHAEAVRITYDPDRISYEALLDEFWRNIDPTDAEGQFGDRGRQYRSGIFYLDETQRLIAEMSKQMAQNSGRFKGVIVTEILPATTFWPAEEDHQDYYKKNPLRYKFFRFGSGRDSRLEKIWDNR